MSKEFLPRPGGIGRLRSKIDASDRQNEIETRVIAIAASVLIVLLIGVLKWSDHVTGEFDLVAMDSRHSQLVEVQVGRPDVRYYWVLKSEE
jgi:hypothetical protein